MEEEKKLKLLKESFEKGVIKKEEYNKQKNEIEAKTKREKTKEEEIPEKKISEKILLFSVLAIIIIFAIIFASKILNKEKIMTIDDLHRLNLQGKLKPWQGYMYNSFSFVNYSGSWHTQYQLGNTLFVVTLNYGPRDLEYIPISGVFNATLFDSSRYVFMTFNPTGESLNYVGVATGEIDRTLIGAFGKAINGSCDRNETEICQTRPIINCENTKNKPVISIQDSNETKITLNNNCIIVQGHGPEIVKAADKLLLAVFYGIM